MRAGLILALLIGLVLLTVVVAVVGYKSVLSAISAAGLGGFAVFTLYWPVVILVLGLAWFAVAPGLEFAKLGALIWARLLRDAGADLLPFAQVSGFLVGVRAAQAAGAPGDLVAASTIVDATTEMAAQVVYTLMGVVVLVAQTRGDPQATTLLAACLAGLGFLLAAAVAFWFIQRGGVSLIGRLAARWAPNSATLAEAVRGHLDEIYRQPGRLLAGAVLHFVGWIGSGLGTWVALRFMGTHAPLLAVLAVDSLMYAARSVAFILPGGLGVQEGAYVLLGPLFGIPPGPILAVSLLRRARDLVIGVPALLVWQGREGRALLARDG
ncbi:lysylphosphatidylglycerol synthase domain-containing protein [Phenylobacterium sp.]|uniref:lysylphosphatidylglycerol synthase domain-containing protein n=1 Tax=Phenylobacterium sp. TaxID=1871053 RepID=UPI002F3E3CC6